MTAADFITVTGGTLPAWAPAAALAAGVVVLLTGAYALRRWGRRDAATKVTTLATVLGLGWSAQGMWDTAVHHYDQGIEVASVLFIVFEAMLVSKMLRAHEYRADRRRRSRFVRAVWVIAAVMALVVALGEGWEQAPARLAVPLLVAYGWYTDLTADDDPAERVDTSLRWTPREVGLRFGILKVTDADVLDATAAERRQLTMRMARLAFAERFGTPWISAVLRRPVRLARLRLLADQEQIAEVRDRLALAAGEEVHPVPPPQPVKPERVPAPHPTPPAEPNKPRPAGGVTIREVDGAYLSGTMKDGGPLADDYAERLRGMPGATTEKVRHTYTPPIGLRVAQAWTSMANKRAAAEQEDGHAPHLSVVP